MFLLLELYSVSQDFLLKDARALVGFTSDEECVVAETQTSLPKMRMQSAQGTLQSDASNISIEIAGATRLAEIESDWADLSARADACNVFMSPPLLRAAMKSYPSKHLLVLLAWHASGAGQQLVGIWAFRVGRLSKSILPVVVLSAPPMPHAYLSTPVVDLRFLDAVLGAMLTRIAAEASLPNIVALDAMSIEGATMQALSRVLASRGCASRHFERFQRPKLVSKLDGKAYFETALSASSRKKLRQHRRRLSEKGQLHFRILTSADAVKEAFEGFLHLEASGWKGRQNTALLSHASDATFARVMIAGLAARSEAAVYMLTLNERPVSMQIILRAGATAFTWKTAYDEGLHDFSPGMLLLEDYTAALLADDGIAYVDSCASDENGYMAVWSERQTVAQLWFDARRGHSSSLVALSWLQMNYLALRGQIKSIYRKIGKR